MQKKSIRGFVFFFDNFFSLILLPRLNQQWIRMIFNIRILVQQKLSMRLFLISGFLGSGKTTSIAQACRQLISSDTRVAVITNDQGLNQVDSAYLKGLRLPVGEVAEGCFAAGLTNWRKL